MGHPGGLNMGQNGVRIGSKHANFPINNDKRLKTRNEYLFLMRNLMLVLISRKIKNLTHLGSPQGSKWGQNGVKHANFSINHDKNLKTRTQ